jgi:hypothetical protein
MFLLCIFRRHLRPTPVRQFSPFRTEQSVSDTHPFKGPVTEPTEQEPLHRSREGGNRSSIADVARFECYTRTMV